MLTKTRPIAVITSVALIVLVVFLAYIYVFGAAGSGLTLSPTSGSPGQTINISGSGLLANTKYGVIFNSKDIASVTTDSNGSFTGSFIVPSLATGSYTVSVGNDAATFSLTGGTITTTSGGGGTTTTTSPPTAITSTQTGTQSSNSTTQQSTSVLGCAGLGCLPRYIAPFENYTMALIVIIIIAIWSSVWFVRRK